MHFEGSLYRALNPLYAKTPASGEGAERYGGRFNARGVPALYTSLSPQTAIRESSQAGSLQPTTLVAFEADIERVFDTRSARALHEYGTNAVELAADDWRERMRDEGTAPTQRLARRLVADGFAGLLVRSFARGATERDHNLVLFDWGDSSPSRLTLVDDDDRLGSARDA